MASLARRVRRSADGKGGPPVEKLERRRRAQLARQRHAQACKLGPDCPRCRQALREKRRFEAWLARKALERKGAA